MDISKGFEDVRVNILTFKATMSSAIGDATSNMIQEIKDVKATITDLEADIKHWTDVVSC